MPDPYAHLNGDQLDGRACALCCCDLMAPGAPAMTWYESGPRGALYRCWPRCSTPTSRAAAPVPAAYSSGAAAPSMIAEAPRGR